MGQVRLALKAVTVGLMYYMPTPFALDGSLHVAIGEVQGREATFVCVKFDVELDVPNAIVLVELDAEGDRLIETPMNCEWSLRVQEGRTIGCTFLAAITAGVFTRVSGQVPADVATRMRGVVELARMVIHDAQAAGIFVGAAAQDALMEYGKELASASGATRRGNPQLAHLWRLRQACRAYDEASMREYGAFLIGTKAYEMLEEPIS